MTGGDAKMGQDFERSVKIAIDEWTAKGGPAGMKIEYITCDDKGDPKEAVTCANNAVQQKVAAVIGHYNSGASIPASAVYNENKIVQITPTSSNRKLTEQGFKGVFRIIGRDDNQGKQVGAYIVKKLQAKNIAIIHDKTAYGQGLAEETKAAIEALGGKVGFFEAITRGEKDFTPILTKLKEFNPDVFYFTGYYAEGAIFQKQAKELGIGGVHMYGDANQDPTFVQVAGPAAEGVLMSTTPLPEMLPEAKNFLAEYKKRYGPEATGPFIHFAYDAANVLFAAVDQCKCTDYDGLVNTLHKIEWKGASGTIKFDEKGDIPGRSYVLIQVKGGKLILDQIVEDLAQYVK
jgi:ABC-type branched-subunit amino acid transport system substrate-binding protein